MIRKISILLAVVPVIVISFNKVSVTHYRDIVADWHGMINTPVRNAFEPILGSDHFENRSYGRKEPYELSAFLWVMMLYVVALVGEIKSYLLIPEERWLLKMVSVANVTIFTWFFVEFLLIFNMVTSIPKILAWFGIVISLMGYRYFKLRKYVT